jgi:ribosome maturation factor RimP
MQCEVEMELDATLKGQLAALVADEGLELLATEVVGAGPKTIVRLVIDGPDGVKLDQCSVVSRQASVILDVEDPIQHGYTLEVSSPGLNRKLYSRDDYGRFSGRHVKIRMKPESREYRVVSGELVGLVGETVVVRLESEEEIGLPYAEVHETRLEIDWTTVMKEGKPRP